MLWLPLKMRTRPLRMRWITWPVSRGWKQLHFWNPRPRFAYSLYNFGGSTMNIIKVICENNARPVLKNVWDSAQSRNHVICLRWPKMSYSSRFRRRWFTVLDFKSWAYSLIYGHFQQHLYCACAETIIYELPCKFRHRRSIRRPRFPVRVQNFGDLVTFSVDFCILYAECPPYFYFRFVWPTDIESIPHASTPTSIIPTKFEVDMCIHYTEL